jgi:nucleoside-diphosphate-sugar epimerase
MERPSVSTFAVPVFDVETLVEMIPDPPDIVVHLAAAGVNPADRTPRRLIEGHEKLTVTMLEAARAWRPRLFIHTGSWSECAPPAPGTDLDEESEIGPTSDYGVAKANASRWAHHLAEKHAISLTTLRLFNVYGPGERLPRLVPTLTEHARRQTVPELSSGSAIRDFVHVDDVAQAFCRVIAARRPLPSVLQVCTGVGTAVRDVVAIAARLADAPQLLNGLGALQDRVGEPPRIVGSTRLLEETIGWSPATSVETGLARALSTKGSNG